MFNKTSAALVLGLGLMGAQSGALAATAAGNFNVNITLTSVCQINSTAGATGATISPIAMSYTGYQATATDAFTSFNVRCTEGQGYSMALDSASLTDVSTGLAYTLALQTTNTPTGTAAGTLGSQVATPTPITYFINSRIVAGQAGSVIGGPANNQRTLTVTY